LYLLFILSSYFNVSYRSLSLITTKFETSFYTKTSII